VELFGANFTEVVSCRLQGYTVGGVEFFVADFAEVVSCRLQGYTVGERGGAFCC